MPYPLQGVQVARSLAHHYTSNNPIHTPTLIHTFTHTLLLLFIRILTNTCTYLTRHISMLGPSFLLFLVCPAFVDKARVMARSLFPDSGLCFNRSSPKQSLKRVSVSGQHKPEVIPVKV